MSQENAEKVVVYKGLISGVGVAEIAKAMLQLFQEEVVKAEGEYDICVLAYLPEDDLVLWCNNRVNQIGTILEMHEQMKAVRWGMQHHRALYDQAIAAEDTRSPGEKAIAQAQERLANDRAERDRRQRQVGQLMKGFEALELDDPVAVLLWIYEIAPLLEYPRVMVDKRAISKWFSDYGFCSEGRCSDTELSYMKASDAIINYFLTKLGEGRFIGLQKQIEDWFAKFKQ